MKTEVIVKQTYFVKILHGENYLKKYMLEYFMKIYKKKFRYILRRRFFFFFSIFFLISVYKRYVKLSNIQ